MLYFIIVNFKLIKGVKLTIFTAESSVAFSLSRSALICSISSKGARISSSLT
ncbi:hypothetical protein CUPS9163_07835 [Campylobacter upsaliensis]|uniref:hypothetical protein n=1 Tax=Campylobacter upsaliensis TaxID=28080 RepID=UPI00214A60A6|nr:hypothetical protein [Campylobacter upsaliensis]MCR2092219.1 hypothetical protein [Campylobacter upsaliensis]